MCNGGRLRATLADGNVPDLRARTIGRWGSGGDNGRRGAPFAQVASAAHGFIGEATLPAAIVHEGHARSSQTARLTPDPQ